MSGKYFKDAISEETIIELTGEMLKEENMNKNLSKPRLGNALLKIIPAAAMVALAIGVINILPAMLNSEPGPNAGNLAPGVYANNYDEEEEIDLFVPWAAEKNFFEERILAEMPEEHVIRHKMLAYYALLDPARFESIEDYLSEHPLDFYLTNDLTYNTLTYEDMKEMLLAYEDLFNQGVAFYLFDIYASRREINQILGFLHDFTDLTGNDIMQMFESFGFPAENPNPLVHFEEEYYLEEAYPD